MDKKRKIELCNCYQLAVKTGNHDEHTLYNIWKKRNKELNIGINAFELDRLRKQFEYYLSSCDKNTENNNTTSIKSDPVYALELAREDEDCVQGLDNQGMYYCLGYIFIYWI